MKNIKVIVWLTQLGLSVALPPLCLIYLAARLQERYSWGDWVIWAAIALGFICAVDGLRTSLKVMEQMSKTEQEKEPPVSFNEHD